MQKRKIVLGDREAKTVVRRFITRAPLRAVAAPNRWAILGANRLGKPAWPSTRKFCRKYRTSRIWPKIWRNPALSTKLSVRTSPESLTLRALLSAGSRTPAHAACVPLARPLHHIIIDIFTDLDASRPGSLAPRGYPSFWGTHPGKGEKRIRFRALLPISQRAGANACCGLIRANSHLRIQNPLPTMPRLESP